MTHDLALLRDVPGRYYARETFGTVDGPGVRYVLFLQGCPLRCLYCHNPDSLDTAGGTATTAGAAADEILRYTSFIKGGGVTFSGGEPLLQAEFLVAVQALLKDKGLHTAIDTAGLPVQGMVKTAIDETDLVLLDIKAADDETARRLSGRDTAYSWQLLDYCESVQKPVWLRHVLVPGYTQKEAALESLAVRLAAYTCIEKVELLPFHKLGEPKWANTAFDYQLTDTPATTKEQAERLREIFARRGLAVQ